jgi:hypothetical protein
MPFSAWKSVNQQDDYVRIKQDYTKRYALRMIQTPLLLKITNGYYYARILNNDVQVMLDKIIAEGKIIRTRGKEVPGLEEVVAAFNNFEGFKEKPNAVFIGDSKEYEDHAFNIHRYTAVSLYRIDLEKHVSLR